MRKEVVVIASLSTTLAVVVAVALINRWKKKKENQYKQTRNLVRKFARECATPVKTLWLVADDLVSNMKASLSSSSSETSTLNMIISYAASLPNGYFIHLLKMPLPVCVFCFTVIRLNYIWQY